MQTPLQDHSKRVEGDITWRVDDHALSLEFRETVSSSSEWPLITRGSFNAAVPALAFSLTIASIGRIYALCPGHDHHNPTCTHTGDCHSHFWTAKHRDKEACAPADILASAAHTLEVREQFCVEARIDHRGTMHSPPAVQGGLRL